MLQIGKVCCQLVVKQEIHKGLEGEQRGRKEMRTNGSSKQKGRERREKREQSGKHRRRDLKEMGRLRRMNE